MDALPVSPTRPSLLPSFHISNVPWQDDLINDMDDSIAGSNVCTDNLGFVALGIASSSLEDVTVITEGASGLAVCHGNHFITNKVIRENDFVHNSVVEEDWKEEGCAKNRTTVSGKCRRVAKGCMAETVQGDKRKVQQ
jgi:hypothetical protein